MSTCSKLFCTHRWRKKNTKCLLQIRNEESLQKGLVFLARPDWSCKYTSGSEIADNLLKKGISTGLVAFSDDTEYKRMLEIFPENLTLNGTNLFVDTLQAVENYGILILVPIGLFLNTLSFIIFNRSEKYSTAVGLHLKCLAVSDNLLILAQVLVSADDDWEQQLGVPSVSLANKFWCKLSNYMLVAGYVISALVLASATVERFLCIAFPMQIKQWNVFLKTKILMGVYCTFGFSVSLFALVAFAPQTTTIMKHMFCRSVPEQRKLWNTVYTIAVTVISNVLCSSTILLFTVLTSVWLYRQRKKRMTLANMSTQISQKEFRITLMLVTVATLFILLRFPKIITEEYLAQKGHTYSTRNLYHWSRAINILMVVNHSFNFVVYIVFLQPFRQTFVDMRSSCKKRPTEDMLERESNVSEIGIELPSVTSSLNMTSE